MEFLVLIIQDSKAEYRLEKAMEQFKKFIPIKAFQFINKNHTPQNKNTSCLIKTETLKSENKPDSHTIQKKDSLKLNK